MHIVFNMPKLVQPGYGVFSPWVRVELFRVFLLSLLIYPEPNASRLPYISAFSFHGVLGVLAVQFLLSAFCFYISAFQLFSFFRLWPPAARRLIHSGSCRLKGKAVTQ
jgi:hypothetical protein